ncbi:MAG: hypothetical protein ABFC73_13945 [Clostridiaceae bacterium]
MEQSKLVQNIIVRARNEALAMRAQSAQTEHIYLAILKISTLTPEKIAPTSSEHAAMDDEIKELNRILEREQISASAAGSLLRSWLKTKPFLKKADAEAEVESMLARAGDKAKDRLKSSDLLLAILSEPKELILSANEGRKPEEPEMEIVPLDDDFFDAETTPGELPKKDAQTPQDPSAPSSGQERGELYAIPGANSQSGGGSERANPDSSGGSSHSNSDAKKRIELPSFDPNEFSGPALTIHNLGDGDGPISGIFDVEPKKKPESGRKPDDPDDHPEPKPVAAKPAPGEKKPEPDSGAKPKGDGVDLGAIMEDLRSRRENGESAGKDDEEPAASVKREPEKPAAEQAKPKREGVDLGAIMEELRQKRLRGESGEPEETKPEPAKKPISEPPKPADASPQKSDEGVDLSAIMKELRERRIRGEQDGGDSPSKPEPPAKAAAKPQTPAASAGKIPTAPVAGAQTIPAAAPRASKFRTTEFLGTTYKGGAFSAMLKYLLRIILIFAATIGAGLLVKAFVPYPAEREAYMTWVLGAMLIIAVYYLLRAVPGLIELKAPAFAQSIKSILAVAMLACVAELYLELAYISNGWVIATKIIVGIACVFILMFGFGKIRMLPNTQDVEIDLRFWFNTLSGSPDKLSNEALMVTCIGPVIAGTIFWILRRPLNAFTAIYLFIIFWYLLMIVTSTHSRWCSEQSPRFSAKEKRRKNWFDFLFTQVLFLSVPAFLFFLSLLFHWFPVPVWAIIVYCFFGLIYLVGTLSTLANLKK